MSNVLVLVHGPEIEHSTNRLYINKYIQVKGHYSTKDFVFDNKLEGGQLEKSFLKIIFIN